MANDKISLTESITKIIQSLSIVIGIVISIVSFNAAREKEAESRRLELEKRKIEAAKPFLELRQKLYLEAVEAASIWAANEEHNEEEIRKARKRFQELYWGALSVVEDRRVECAMIRMAVSLNITQPTNDDCGKLETPKNASYKLSHVIRDSLLSSWGIEEKQIGEVNR